MQELQKILKESSEHLNFAKFAQDIEIYIAKQYIFNIVQNGENSVKIFPKDGSHYIELSSNHGVEEKLYAVFFILYELGLHHYINAMHFYGGNVSFQIKKMYQENNVPEIFNKKLKNSINVCGDCLCYDFDNKYFNNEN
jgi:hypothetical protein